MAKRIIWTEQAKFERQEILNYWFFRTGNKKYSRKLAFDFRETVKYISLHNYLGRATELEDVRVAVCGNYLLFYKIDVEVVSIITVFDSRRNPKDLDI
jgi:plasmid stabilization system protein ParE